MGNYHLSLVREEPNPARRRHKRGGNGPNPPPRGSRKQFAGEMRDRLTALETGVATKLPSPAGIAPHLVFRVPLAKGASSTEIAKLLEALGIAVVSIESDNAIIAFQNNADLAQFRQAIASYERGPRVNIKTGKRAESTKWNVFEFIEAAELRLWGRSDRIGRRLAQVIGEDSKRLMPDHLYVVDVELWHQGTSILARAGVKEIQQLVNHRQADGEQLSDSFVGQLLCLARVKVRGKKLNDLLDLDIVAEVELPPEPVFNHREALRATKETFPVPPVPMPMPGGPTVCVVDSGVASNHPLLASNIGHATSVNTATGTAADENGHGTMVSGIAVFGDIRTSYVDGSFSSPLTLFSARVLNADHRFDDDKLVIHQIEESIKIFVAEPYLCRVFNMSLGDCCA